ncbi:hypothetical protein K488DRAFT_76951 [Vararia minispora EC-137]|uniref:Uncharacterized protein n=1 Tax=Vararia minispora EC-137 TaxID=1314806 RepID=A0ACB8QTN9_9AGAM|nr:hypothetical protein K488DRAFT_76951 [Vararia minispora EC-137]
MPPNGPSEVEQLQQLLDVSTKVLDQALDLLDNSVSDDGQLTASSRFLPGSTIGKHLRHARDHFVLLLDCISSPPPYVLSYDVRVRNTPMETSRKAAREAMDEVKKRLALLAPRVELNAPLTLNAITPYEQTFTSTVGREMWFAGLHAIHHWSMVRVIAGELGITLEDTFGYAPSTLVHKGSSGPLATAKI